MSEPDSYDVVVVGAGPAGENAAQYAVQGTGLNAALVEQELVGGECSYWACMPSKALLRPLEVAADTRGLGGVGDAPVLPEGLLARRDQWRSDLDDSGQVRWADSLGVAVIRGRGRLDGPRRVTVTGPGGARTLTARHAVVLATGSSPVVPPNLAPVRPWTSRDATGVTEVPGSLAIVGGGVVAVEAATWLAALGSRVTLLVRGERLLPRFDSFVSSAVADGLRRQGLAVVHGARITRAQRPEACQDAPTGHLHGGPVTLTVNGRDRGFDEVLAATGRRPSTENLGLDTVGMSAGDLDGRVDLGLGWLYAVGDVSAGPQLTHWGKYQARVVGELIAARAGGADPGVPSLTAPVPQAVFTDPPVAQVGLTAAEGRRQGRPVRTVDQPMTAVAGVALLRDDATGTARLVVEDDRIVGATFVGPAATELLHAATIAITSRISLTALRDAVPAYPTASEIWLRLVEAAVRP